MSVDMDANLNLTTGVLYEKDGTRVSGGGRFMIADLADFGPVGTSRLYRSIITISPLVRTSDLGQWTCQVNFSSTNALVGSSSLQSKYFLNENEIPGKRVKPYEIIHLVVRKFFCYHILDSFLQDG